MLRDSEKSAPHAPIIPTVPAATTATPVIRLHGWQELDRRELPRRGQRFNHGELNLVDPPTRHAEDRTLEFSIITTSFELKSHHPSTMQLPTLRI